jgi:hypothetical protein
MKKIISAVLTVLLATAAFAATVPVKGEKEGSVDKKWVKEILKKLPDDVVFYDSRSEQEYADKHTNGVKNVPVALFDKDGACEKILPLISPDKVYIFLCPFGPRAEEMYYNIKDPVKDGGCGYEGTNIYWLDGKVKFNPDGLDIKTGLF